VSDGVSNTTGIAVNSGKLVLRYSAQKFLTTGLSHFAALRIVGNDDAAAGIEYA